MEDLLTLPTLALLKSLIISESPETTWYNSGREHNELPADGGETRHAAAAWSYAARWGPTTHIHHPRHFHGNGGGGWMFLQVRPLSEGQDGANTWAKLRQMVSCSLKFLFH